MMMLAARLSVVALALFGLSGCNPFADSFLAGCEEAIKERLKSPSSYERVSVTETVTPLSYEEYAEHLKDDGESEGIHRRELEFFKDGTYKPKRYEIDIYYDASNSYGAMTRNASTCKYMSSSGERPSGDILRYVVEVDGQTSLAWLHTHGAN